MASRSWPGTPLARGVGIALLLAAIATVVIFLPEPPISQETREAVLRNNLQAIREAVETYRTDHGQGPQSLDALVEAGYLRRLPVDPMRGNSQTWDVVKADDGTIIEVHSSSGKTATDGSSYNDW